MTLWERVLGDETRYRRHVAYAAFVGLMLRVLLVLVCRSDAGTGDSDGYYRLAFNVAHHGVFSLDSAPPFTPTVTRAPLTSLALSLPLWLFDDHVVGLYALLVLVNLGGALALALGARHHLPRIRIPLLWVLAVSPFTAIYSSMFYSETFATAGVCVAVGALLFPPSRGAAIVAGLGLAAAALSRDIYLPLLLLLPGGAYLLSRRNQSGGAFERKHVAAALVASALLIAPWSLRNLSVGKPTLVSKGLLGVNLWIGTWERNGAWMNVGVTPPPEAYDSPEERARIVAVAGDPAAADSLYRAVAIQRLTSRPLSVFLTWVRRSPYLWLGSRTELFEFRPAFLQRGKPAWKLLKVTAWALSSTVLLLAAAGVVLVLRARTFVRLLLVPVVFTAAIYLPFHSTENRYSEPVFPLLLVFATLAAATAHGRLFPSRAIDDALSDPEAPAGADV